MALLQKAYLGATPLFRTTPWWEDNDMVPRTAGSQVTLTASASTNTKGSYSEMIASVSGETTFLVIWVAAVGANGIDTSCLIDIATGASGSETVIVPDVAFGGAGGFPNAAVACVNIASGTRIAARMQCATASRTAAVRIFAYDFGEASLTPTSVDTLGISTATSRGTQLSANNAWTQIIASTNKDYTAFCVVPSCGANAVSATVTPIMEIGVGASGSEVSFGLLPFRATTSEEIGGYTGVPLLFSQAVPTGSRIAVRQSSNQTSIDACVIAIPKV
jgi:hypothetical protein